MRVRHKPWAKDKLNDHPEYVIQNPEKYRSQWKNLFHGNETIHLEIGTGKGQFITEMAKGHPDVAFIGIEQSASIIVDALDKCTTLELPNLKLINVDAKNLTDFFDENELSRIYLNFSDPWPKNRHEKRRLTYKEFLKQYEVVLMQGGDVHIKTDNQGLFEYSLESLSQYGIKLQNISLDLHKDHPKWNIMTEYEEKFSSRGQRIYRCEGVF